MFDGIPKNLIELSRRLLKDASGGGGGLKQVLREASARVNAPWAAPTSFAAQIAAGTSEIAAFGANPGGLRMFLHVPPKPPLSGAPLVVVLHGCGQHAVQFALDTGWTAMADRLGFPLVLPEQTGDNNAGRCFNWFRAADIARDQGEARSIREMVGFAAERFRSDQRRVFVVGLSAGGGMAAALLAAYPDVFAAGAVVAGLPVGVATNIGSAMSVMAGRDQHLTPDAWAAAARALGPAAYAGPWPRLQLWQGTRDHTVAASNAKALATQWVALAGLAGASARDTQVTPTLRRRAWGPQECPVVESWTVEAMAHGYPIDGEGVADRFVLRVGIDTTAAIATFWGLIPAG